METQQFGKKLGFLASELDSTNSRWRVAQRVFNYIYYLKQKHCELLTFAEEMQLLCAVLIYPASLLDFSPNWDIGDNLVIC